MCKVQGFSSVVSITLFLLGSFFSPFLGAQDPDPLAVTLPNGKILHFQSTEQKAKYEVARQRAAQGSNPPSTAPVPAIPRPRVASSLDAPTTAGTGRGSATAPIFTADYYNADPASWVGKSVTLSVAYLTPGDEADLTDGMRRLTAVTYNYNQGINYYETSGGHIPVLAKPDDVFKLINLCGTKYQYNGGYRMKMTILKGTFTKVRFKDPALPGEEHYCVILGKE